MGQQQSLSLQDSIPKFFSSKAPLSQEDTEIFEWRIDKCKNQDIPRVTIKNASLSSTGIEQKLLSSLSNHEPKLKFTHQLEFEKYIGNLSFLEGRLQFDECIYVLKSLLSGYEAIYNYFGKAIVEREFCFITKEGEVRAWINADYRKNNFGSLKSTTNSPQTTDRESSLFIKPSQWIDSSVPTQSIPSIVQSVLLMITPLAQAGEASDSYEQFLSEIDSFIVGNILKNYNFHRVKKFINRFVYENRVLIKPNLKKVIERLYQEYVESQQNEQLGTNTKISEKGFVLSDPPHAKIKELNNMNKATYHTIEEESEYEKHPSTTFQQGRGFYKKKMSKQFYDFKASNCRGSNQTEQSVKDYGSSSLIRSSSFYMGKNPNVYSSLATKEPRESNISLTHQRNKAVFENAFSRNRIESMCPPKMAHSYLEHQNRFLSTQGKQNSFWSGIQVRDRNCISPQFSVNYMNIQEKGRSLRNAFEDSSRSKLKSSYQHTPKSSILSNRSSTKNKNVEFKVPNDEKSQPINLRVITEKKQTEPEEQFSKIAREQPSKSPTNFYNNIHRPSISPIQKQSEKDSVYSSHRDTLQSYEQEQRQKQICQNKASAISINQMLIEDKLKERKNQAEKRCSKFAATSTLSPKMFKSDCVDENQQPSPYQRSNQKQLTTFFAGEKPQQFLNESNSFVSSHSGTPSQKNRPFTMKTITRLISSNDSGQQESVGSLPTNQDFSEYSGVLASMGRSVTLFKDAGNIKQPPKANNTIGNFPVFTSGYIRNQNSPNPNIVTSHCVPISQFCQQESNSKSSSRRYDKIPANMKSCDKFT